MQGVSKVAGFQHRHLFPTYTELYHLNVNKFPLTKIAPARIYHACSIQQCDCRRCLHNIPQKSPKYNQNNTRILCSPVRWY